MPGHSSSERYRHMWDDNANSQQLVSVLTLQMTSTVLLPLSDSSNVQMNMLLLFKTKNEVSHPGGKEKQQHR